jgi:hypothetical protein
VKRALEQDVPRRFLALVPLFAVLWLFTLALVLSLIPGCGGGAPAIARTLVEKTGEGLVVVDDFTAVAYEAHHASALASSVTLAEYAASMQAMNDLEVALRTLSHALFAAEHVLDTWDAGGAEDWVGAAACLAGALVDVNDALVTAGVAVPRQLEEALDFARPFIGVLCPPGGAS